MEKVPWDVGRGWDGCGGLVGDVGKGLFSAGRARMRILLVVVKNGEWLNSKPSSGS